MRNLWGGEVCAALGDHRKSSPHVGWGIDVRPIEDFTQLYLLERH